ncbi:hypothetical protein OROHE_010492 [Orobanche hederae]
MMNNLIATDANLSRHHVPVRGTCFWCKMDWGTTTHCLIFCGAVKKVWKYTHFWGEIKNLSKLSIEDICRVVYAIFGDDGLERWFINLWVVWTNLCRLKHGDLGTDFAEAMRASKVMLANFQEARQNLDLSQRLLPSEGSRTWQCPSQGCLRLNVDVSVLHGGQLVGFGFIIRDHCGGIVAAVSRRIGFTATVLMGELHAMLLGIGFCLEHDLGPVVLFTDSLLAVHVVNDTYKGLNSLCDDLFDAFAHARQNVVLDFRHARREANRAAPQLARFAFSSPDVMIWKADFPSWLLDIVLPDLI